MARVHHRRANKDYPEAGIQKGEMYYYAKIKTGPYSSRTIRQKAPIKPSQLTSSEYLSRLYELQEQMNGLDDLEAAREIAESLRELGEEQREKFDNMPEGLQQGDTGQMLEERAEACESAADEIETLIDGWDEDTAKQEVLDEADEEDGELDEGQIEDRIAEKRQEVIEAIQEQMPG